MEELVLKYLCSVTKWNILGWKESCILISEEL